jgi:uncharacterized membrane protein
VRLIQNKMEQLASSSIRYITRVGVIAGVYVVVTVLLAPISFGPIQLRISEALTVLPIIFPEAVSALFIGVLISNIYGGLGMYDVVFGSIITLIAAYVSWRFRHNTIAYLSPVVFNGLFVSLYLHMLFKWPYWLTVLSISASEAVVVFALGFPLIRYLRPRS